MWHHILEGSVIDFHSCYFINFDSLQSQRSVDQVPGGGEVFCACPDALGPTQPLVQWVPEFFPGVKQPERVVSPRTMEPTLSSETSAFELQTPGKFPKEHRLQPERVFDHPAQSSAEVKERVGYSPILSLGLRGLF